MSGKGRNNGKPSKRLANGALKPEVRRHKRYRTESLLLDNPVVGRVVNVGEAGFAIETPESLAVGSSYLFKVRLGDKHLRLSGRIQWCRLMGTEANGNDEALPVYKAGIALAETVTSKAWQEALKRLTDESAYLIWHKARSKTSEEAPAEPLTEAAEQESAEQLET